jgi:hypothetical protein
MSQVKSIQALQNEGHEEIGKLTKLVQKIQKAISKEFLLIIGAIIFAIPISYFMYLILQNLLTKDAFVELAALTEEVPLFMWCYAIAVAGCYFSRMVFSAIQSLTQKSGE